MAAFLGLRGDSRSKAASADPHTASLFTQFSTGLELHPPLGGDPPWPPPMSPPVAIASAIATCLLLVSFFGELTRRPANCPLALFLLLLACSDPKTVEAVIGRVLQSLSGARVLYLGFACACVCWFCLAYDRVESVCELYCRMYVSFVGVFASGRIGGVQGRKMLSWTVARAN